MYKVLLVDDEMFVRKGLTQLIDWNALGYAVTEEAENGEEALEIIDRTKPDLVVTDIRMPVLDGLGLIASVREKIKEVPEFIIISGYHDFKYAQQAIRYGVHDYVLKPVDEDELIATLKKLSGRLSRKKLDRIHQGKPASGSIMDALIQGSLREEDAEVYANALELKHTGPYHYVLVAASPNLSDGRQPEAALPGHVVSAAIKEQGIFGPEEDPIFYEQGPGKYGILLDTVRLQAAGGNLEALLRTLQASLSKAFPAASFTLYAGKEAAGLETVRDSYQTANEAAQYHFACKGDSVIYYDKVQSLTLYYLDMDGDLYARLMEQVEENKSEAYLKTVDSMFQEFHYKRFAPTAVANSISRCLIGIVNVIRDMEGDEHQLASLEPTVGWQLHNLDPMGLKEQFLLFIAEAAAYIERLRKEQTKGGIEKIRKYIETHFTQNISLKTIAAQFYMNPVYLGQLFRKTYGVYFNDFLLNLRVQEAKKLLRQTDMRMYEIAEKVGFHNADYFVTQFEKLEHMTPTEYRNKLIGKK